MKVDVKRVDELKRELKFEIPSDRVAKKLEEVYKEIGKKAKIKGFRPGKAPRHVLESHHGEYAQEETVKKLIPEVYQEAVEQEKLTPLDLPEIEDVSFKDGIVTFTAKLDVKPEVKLKNYKGIKVKRKSSEVTEEEIAKTLEFLKKGQGEDKEVTIDDAFAKGLGFPSLEDFKKSMRRQLEMDKERQNRVDIENQIVENLIKQTKFSIPQAFVERQLDRRLHELKHRLESQGMPAEEISKKTEEMRNEVKQNVEKEIRIFLILEKVAELENMDIKQGDNMPVKVMELLLKEAEWVS